MTRIRLDQIVFDAGTQIRAAIDQHVVTEYAEAMTEGATFPPVVLFHDGTQHYLADGFHRFLAAQRNTFNDIDADVRAGTRDDALWFALGANRINGQRLSVTDKKRAILLALATWPERSANQIAEQIGVNAGYFSRVKAQHNVKATPDEARVVGRDGKTYPASSPKPMRAKSDQFVAVRAMVEEGKSTQAIREKLGAAFGTIAKVRKSLGLTRIDSTRAGVRQRRERMRAMAAEGHTSIQIAHAVGVSVGGCRQTLRDEHIEVPADKATHHTRRIDPNRIVEQIVADADNLVECVQLVDFRALDQTRVGDWIDSLIASKRALESFIKRLIKERSNGEAA